MIDPRRCKIGLDANALDESSPEQAGLVRRFIGLVETGRVAIMVPGGVGSEVQHPRTPGLVRDAILPRASSLRAGLNQAQHINRIRVRAILRGDAQPGKHEADAAHLCDADEAGCGYFITHDKRILRKRGDLRQALPSLAILPLARFLEVFDRFETDPSKPLRSGH